MKPMSVKSFIFDLDGTLVHTTPEYRYMVVGNTLETFNIKSTKKDIDDFWFLSEKDRIKIIKDIWKLDPEEQFWPAFREYDALDLRKKHTWVYDDVGILSLLNKNGLRTGIVTSAPTHIIKLELSLLDHEFGSVVRAKLADGVKQKPDPEGLIKCMDDLGVNSSNTLYIGNSKEDMEMARNAQVYGVFVERREYDFGEIEADLTITSLEALRELI